MNETYFSLGSNKGDRLANMNECLERMRALYGNAIKSSSLYETASWGFDSEPFLNQVVSFLVNKDPEEILDNIQYIENSMGRIRSGSEYISRTIDIDILFIDGIILNTEKLIVPHKHISSRKFVLVPLNEISPDFEHPVLKLPISHIHDMCTDTCSVVKWDRE